MEKCVADTYIVNGLIKSCEEFDLSILCRGTTIYEVVRVIDGVILFLEEHVERLFQSARVANLEMKYTSSDLIEMVHKLKINNNNRAGNIKLSFNLSSLHSIYLANYIESNYPTELDYQQGVNTIMVNAERSYPNVKIYNHDLREKVNNIIESKNVYEAILVSEKEYITEGNRSNIFVIKNNAVITPPVEKVLNGITRRHIVSICKNSNIPLLEREIRISDLQLFDAAFLSGTSPKVLPLKNIEDIHYTVENELMKFLMKEYENDIEEYIKIHKR